MSQCYFGHHKSHTGWPGIESRPSKWEAGDRPFSNTEIHLNCLPKHEHSDRCFSAVYTQSACSTTKCLLYVTPGLKSSHSADTVYVSILQEAVVHSTYRIYQMCSLKGTNWTAIHNDNFSLHYNKWTCKCCRQNLTADAQVVCAAQTEVSGSNLRPGGLLLWGFNAVTESRQENDDRYLMSYQNRLLSCASQLTVTLTVDAIRL